MINEAQHTDPLELEGYFYSDVPAFISAALVANPLISIKKVVAHPVKPGQKLFYLAPKSACIQLWEDFRNNNLKVDAKSQAVMIKEVLNHPLTEFVPQQRSFVTVGQSLGYNSESPYSKMPQIEGQMEKVNSNSLEEKKGENNY